MHLVNMCKAWYFNKYNVQPYGNCPVQAEGHLLTGEYYYFRARGRSWSLRIAKDQNSIFSNSAWVFSETKYEEFEAGWIDKLEVVKNFNKAMRFYLNPSLIQDDMNHSQIDNNHE